MSAGQIVLPILEMVNQQVWKQTVNDFAEEHELTAQLVGDLSVSESGVERPMALHNRAQAGRLTMSRISTEVLMELCHELVHRTPHKIMTMLEDHLAAGFTAGEHDHLMR